MSLKMASWKDHIVAALNELGGEASYQELYPVLEKLRRKAGSSLTPKWKQTVQGTIEENSPDSLKFKPGRKPVFYSVQGIGKGRWALYPSFLSEDADDQEMSYESGLEGVLKEHHYLRRSRDPRLVEARKIIDDFTCQSCGYRRELFGRFVIEVHHLRPISSYQAEGQLSSIEDLICLCPRCHREAHSRSVGPLSLEELKALHSV
ncbi:HNH endonuclease [Phaeobacter inhibens]|uniref:HNH endonuclease n=1 Tax=Phaeobacter inhibens TaxID=221822 RepID=UPI0035CD0A35